MASVANVVMLSLCSGVWEWWGLLWLALRAWARPATTYPPAPSQIHANALPVDLTEPCWGTCSMSCKAATTYLRLLLQAIKS